MLQEQQLLPGQGASVLSAPRVPVCTSENRRVKKSPLSGGATPASPRVSCEATVSFLPSFPASEAPYFQGGLLRFQAEQPISTTTAKSNSVQLVINFKMIVLA